LNFLSTTGQIAETGIEHLRIAARDHSINYRVDPEFDGIFINNVLDPGSVDWHS
jgi:hypothetical protein